MTELESIHTGRHRAFAMHAHLVFVTKFRHKVFWSGSYFAGSVGGAPPSIVKQYIERQNRPT
ncbi:transposase [Micromonospora pattaloongensis]|nr:transposase [Micromonospora pattaloongensis]